MVVLEAEQIEVVSETARNIATVRSQGRIHEEEDGPALPFDQIRRLVKSSANCHGWAVAGIQQPNRA